MLILQKAYTNNTYMLKPIVLKNGLTVIKLPKPSSKMFITGFVTLSGSAQESDNFPQGMSRLIEKLFRCGTDKHPSAKNLTTALEGMGAEYISQTNQELTQHYISTPSNHQYKAVSMLAEIIQHSYFDHKDIEQEKQNTIEYVKSFDAGDGKQSPLALSNLYVNHSLGLPISGSIETLTSIRKTDIDNYMFHQYHTNRSYVILAGNFDSKTIMDLVDQEWGYWNPKNRRFVESPSFDYQDAGSLPRIQYRQRGLPYTELVISFLLDEGLKPKYEQNPVEEQKQLSDTEVEELKDRKLSQDAELLVMNTILGQGYSSRLWSKGVEEELFFNDISSDLIRFQNTGYLQIKGKTDNSQFTFALECIFSVLDSLKQTTISINELAKAKEYLKGRLVLESENLLSSTLWQVENMLGSSLIYDLDDMIEKINKVEASGIRSRALDLFIPQRMAITTLGTAKETRLVDKLIAKYIG
jgi:predicted Zn-dependent peptidase